ncbi:MAG: NAD(P)-dependent oxidoreductase [Candidatus Tectomicrobia bacterium]|nr:NAD(P)-dependent oxidoreductase [Candidatus Tectomicrobia bacterium]
MPDSIGIIGLGNAGSALATALSGKVPLVGYDLDAGRRQALADLEMEPVESVAQVGTLAKRVVLSLPAPDISRSVVTELLAAESLPDLIVETSTITPKVAMALDSLCQTRRVRFVDAAVASGVAAMAAGQVTFLVGGRPPDVEIARHVLAPMAKRILHLGPVGSGMGAKVVNNAVMHAVMVVLIEAAALASKLDLSMSTLVDLLQGEEGLKRPLTHRVCERMLQGRYEGGMSVLNARKDSALALEIAQQLGVPLYAIQASHTPYEIAAASGLENLDYASLATLWEEWCNVEFSGG